MIRFWQKLLRRNRTSISVDFSKLPENLDARQELSRRIGEEVQRRLTAEDGYQYKALMFRDYPGQEKAAGSRRRLRRGMLAGMNIDFRRPDDNECVEIEAFSCSRLEDASQVAAFALAAIYTFAAFIHWMITPARPGDDQVMWLPMVILGGLIIGYLFWAVFRIMTGPIVWAFGLMQKDVVANEVQQSREAIRDALQQLGYSEVAAEHFKPAN